MEGTDEPEESDVSAGAGAGTPPSAPDRPWRHPSEVGMDVRVQSDRRRGMGMVIAFVGVAGLVLVATTALTRLSSNEPDPTASDERAGAPLVAATVQLDTAAGSRRAIAAIVQGGTHALASGSELGTIEGAGITVRAGDTITNASVAATDTDTDMVLLELDEAVDISDAGMVEPSVGDSYRFTHLDHMSHIDTEVVAIESLGEIALRPNGTPAPSVMVLDGWTDHQGPLTDSAGHLAGWVFPTKGAHMAAYDAGTVEALARRMASSG
ncbi:MAG: hypothetical protein ACR2OH_13230 [Microthrixaceae bacterium]